MLLNKKKLPGTQPQTRKKHRFFLVSPRSKQSMYIKDLIRFGSVSSRSLKRFNKCAAVWIYPINFQFGSGGACNHTSPILDLSALHGADKIVTLWSVVADYFNL